MWEGEKRYFRGSQLYLGNGNRRRAGARGKDVGRPMPEQPYPRGAQRRFVGRFRH